MSICSKCGATLADGAKFCVTCGTPVAETPVQPTPVQPQPTPVQPQPTPVQPQGTPFQGQQVNQSADVKQTAANVTDKITDSVNKATKQNFKKPVVIGVLAALAVLIVVIFLSIIINIIGGAYKKPIKNFAKAINKGDAEKYVESMIPEKYVESDAYDMFDYVEDYDNFKIKIYDKHKVTKAEMLEYGEDWTASYYADDNLKLSKCYKVVCYITYEDDGKDKSYATELVVGKYKGKWYIVN